MEVGKDVRRRGSKAIAKLSDHVQGMMNQWTEEQFPNFVETMELIRDGAPVQYVKLYMEAVKLGVVRQTDINININRQKDREDLQALVRTKIQLPTEIGTQRVEYTPFEEVEKEEGLLGEPAWAREEGTPAGKPQGTL